MNATIQTTQSMTASAAILNAQTNAAKAKTPHTHSALSSTINIQRPPFKGKPLAIKHKKSEATRLSDNLDLDFF